MLIHWPAVCQFGAGSLIPDLLRSRPRPIGPAQHDEELVEEQRTFERSQLTPVGCLGHRWTCERRRQRPHIGGVEYGTRMPSSVSSNRRCGLGPSRSWRTAARHTAIRSARRRA